MPLAAIEGESLALRITLSTLSEFSLLLQMGLFHNCERSRLSNVPPASVAAFCHDSGSKGPASGCTEIKGFFCGFMINNPEVVGLY